MQLTKMLELAEIDKKTIEDLTDAIGALENPESLLDQKQIADLNNEIEKAAPGSIEKVVATLALAKVSEVDTSSIETDALSALKSVLGKIPLTAEQCLSMGVPANIVNQALKKGVNIDGIKKNQKERAPRVSASEIEAAVLAMTGSFTISSISVGSPASITKIVKDLIVSGKLKDLGPDKTHSGRGRAPKLYTATSVKDGSK